MAKGIKESYQSVLDKISALQKKASSLRDNEKKRVVVEMRKLVELYDVQPAELFSNAKPAPDADAPAPRKRAKRVLFPKYRDPVTGKTWNGHGKRPLWLVGVDDKEAYLITEADAGDAAAKPKGTRAGRKSNVDKVIADVKSKRGRSPKRQTSGTMDSPPKTDDIPVPATPSPTD
jgi:DNA-binding protein H-NS